MEMVPVYKTAIVMGYILFAHSFTALNVILKDSTFGTKWRISSVTRQPEISKVQIAFKIIKLHFIRNVE